MTNRLPTRNLLGCGRVDAIAFITRGVDLQVATRHMDFLMRTTFGGTACTHLPA